MSVNNRDILSALISLWTSMIVYFEGPWVQTEFRSRLEQLRTSTRNYFSAAEGYYWCMKTLPGWRWRILRCRLCDAASDWLEQTRNIMYWPQVLARSDLHCTSSARWKSHKYNKVKTYTINAHCLSKQLILLEMEITLWFTKSFGNVSILWQRKGLPGRQVLLRFYAGRCNTFHWMIRYLLENHV